MLNEDMRQRLLKTARHHLLTIEHIVQNLTEEQATTLRDGADGWNTVEFCAICGISKPFFVNVLRKFWRKMSHR